MASNNTGETVTTSSVNDNPALSTPNTADASAGPSSSSYANVVLSLKPTQQGINDNNKENISDINKSKIKANSPIINNDVHQSQPVIQQNKEKSTDPIASEDEDDSHFTPVLSHSRKERNTRIYKRRVRERPQGGRGNGGNSGNRDDGTGTAAPPATRSGQAKDSKRRNRKKSVDNTTNSTVTTEQQVNKSSSNSQNEDEDDGQDESAQGATKFVDAPIPKENAWKVNIYLFYFTFFHIYKDII